MLFSVYLTVLEDKSDEEQFIDAYNTYKRLVYYTAYPVISPEFPLRTKHSDIKRTLPPLGKRLQRLFGIRGRMICQTKRLPTNAMLLACVFLFVKNAPAVHQV